MDARTREEKSRRGGVGETGDVWETQRTDEFVMLVGFFFDT